MRTPAPPLLPLLRSQAQGELLALLYLNPDREFSLTDAAQRCRTSVKTIHHEANRLVEAGFVAERRLGNVRLLRAGDPGRGLRAMRVPRDQPPTMWMCWLWGRPTQMT
jgi:hypothetical protein